MAEISFVKKFKSLFDNNVHEIVEPSGRCSGKSTHNEIYAITKMFQSGANNGVYARAEHADIRTTIFSSFAETASKMGVYHLYDFKMSPFLARNKKTGAICYFLAINGKTETDTQTTKGFVPKNGSLSWTILDEADTVKSSMHITAFETTMSRFFLEDYKKIWSYNPPYLKKHWANNFFSDKIKSGATKIYTTYEDVRTLLPQATITEIEKMRQNDPDFFRYWYLGQATNLKGAVYPQLNEANLTNIYSLFIEGDRVVDVCFGVDEGSVFDSTCVTVLAIMFSGRAVVLSCLEIDPVKTGALAPSEQAKKLKDFLYKTVEKFPFLQNIKRYWIFESAEAGQNLMQQFLLECGGNEDVQPVRQKSIMGDVKRVRTMLNEKILLFDTSDYDEGDSPKKLVEDIQNYFFDEKTGAIKPKQRDDTIDSLEYATKLYYSQPLTTKPVLL